MNPPPGKRVKLGDLPVIRDSLGEKANATQFRIELTDSVSSDRMSFVWVGLRSIFSIPSVSVKPSGSLLPVSVSDMRDMDFAQQEKELKTKDNEEMEETNINQRPLARRRNLSTRRISLFEGDSLSPSNYIDLAGDTDANFAILKWCNQHAEAAEEKEKEMASKKGDAKGDAKDALAVPASMNIAARNIHNKKAIEAAKTTTTTTITTTTTAKKTTPVLIINASTCGTGINTAIRIIAETSGLHPVLNVDCTEEPLSDSSKNKLSLGRRVLHRMKNVPINMNKNSDEHSTTWRPILVLRDMDSTQRGLGSLPPLLRFLRDKNVTKRRSNDGKSLPSFAPIIVLTKRWWESSNWRIRNDPLCKQTSGLISVLNVRPPSYVAMQSFLESLLDKFCTTTTTATAQQQPKMLMGHEREALISNVIAQCGSDWRRCRLQLGWEYALQRRPAGAIKNKEDIGFGFGSPGLANSKLHICDPTDLRSLSRFLLTVGAPLPSGFLTGFLSGQVVNFPFIGSRLLPYLFALYCSPSVKGYRNINMKATWKLSSILSQLSCDASTRSINFSEFRTAGTLDSLACLSFRSLGGDDGRISLDKFIRMDPPPRSLVHGDHIVKKNRKVYEKAKQLKDESVVTEIKSNNSNRRSRPLTVTSDERSVNSSSSSSLMKSPAAKMSSGGGSSVLGIGKSLRSGYVGVRYRYHEGITDAVRRPCLVEDFVS